MKNGGNDVMGRRKVSNLKVKVSKNGMKKQRLALSSSAEAEGDGSGYSCGECGKIFKSCKAMYGHMRTHPERRGFKNLAGAAGVGHYSGSRFANAAWFGSDEMEAVSGLLMLADGPCSTSVSHRRGGSGLGGCLGAIESIMEVDTSSDTTMEGGEENAAQSRNPLASLDLNQLPGFTKRGSSSGCCCPVEAMVLDLSLGL